MAQTNQKQKSQSPHDDDLLAGAIPIDQAEASQSSATERSQSPAADEPVDIEPIEIEEASEPASEPDQEAGQGGAARRRAIQVSGDIKRHEQKWNRTPNTPGNGAIHVKTFVAKLRLDAVEHMDEQINQWLDSHPQYEVKFVTESVGMLKGKTDEEALFLSVWV